MTRGMFAEVARVYHALQGAHCTFHYITRASQIIHPSCSSLHKSYIHLSTSLSVCDAFHSFEEKYGPRTALGRYIIFCNSFITCWNWRSILFLIIFFFHFQWSQSPSDFLVTLAMLLCTGVINIVFVSRESVTSFAWIWQTIYICDFYPVQSWLL